MKLEQVALIFISEKQNSLLTKSNIFVMPKILRVLPPFRVKTKKRLYLDMFTREKECSVKELKVNSQSELAI